MKLNSLIGKIVSLLDSKKERKGPAKKLLEKVQGLFYKNFMDCAKERNLLIKKAVALEKRFADREFTKQDYYSLKSAIHKKMILIDLESAIIEASIKVAKLAKKFSNFKDAKNFIKLEELLTKFNSNISEMETVKSFFDKNKLDAGSFEDKLKEVHSNVLDIEFAIKHLYKEAWAKEEAQNIMQETKALLEGNEKPVEVHSRPHEHSHKHPHNEHANHHSPKKHSKQH